MNTFFVLSCLAASASTTPPLFNYYKIDKDSAWGDNCQQAEDKDSTQLSPVVLAAGDDAAEAKIFELLFKTSDVFKSEQVYTVDAEGNKSMIVNVTNSTDDKKNMTVKFGTSKESVDYTFSKVTAHWGKAEHMVEDGESDGSFQVEFTAGNKSLIVEIAVKFDAAAGIEAFPPCPADLTKSGNKGASTSFNPMTLIADKSAFHYVGSRTIPKCAVPVDWIVVKDVIKVKDAEAALSAPCKKFAEVFPQCGDLSGTGKECTKDGTEGTAPLVPGNYRRTVALLDETAVANIAKIAKPASDSTSSASTSLAMTGMVFALVSMIF